MTAIKDKLVTVEGLKYVIDNYSNQLCRIVRLKTSEVSSWGDIYNQLYSMAIEDAAVIVIESGVASSLFSSLLDAHSYTGTVIRVNDTSTLTGNYKFNVASFNSNEIVDFQILGLSSATATPTLSLNGYFYGGATKQEIRHNIDAAGKLTLTGTSFSALYTELSVMSVGDVNTYNAVAAVNKVLTGNKLNALASGTVYRANDTVFEFLAGQAGSTNIYKWRITYDSTYSTATVGTVYNFTGTAV